MCFNPFSVVLVVTLDMCLYLYVYSYCIIKLIFPSLVLVLYPSLVKIYSLCNGGNFIGQNIVT